MMYLSERDVSVYIFPFPLLLQLLQVYNQNGDGYVCLQEFIEAHGILQIAVRMNPSDEEDPPVVRGDLHNLYAHILEDSDPWMQDATACTHSMSCSFNICSSCSSSSLFQLLLLV